MEVSVVITGDKELSAKLMKLEEGLTNFTNAFETMGTKLIDYTENQVFASQGGVFGKPWAKLAASTVAGKKKNYRQYSAVPLVASDVMRHSFRKTSTRTSLKIDNTAKYFVYHQSSAPRHKLPRRQMLGVNPGVKSIIQQVLEADIRRKIGSL